MIDRFEDLNATRMSVAGEGSSEPLLDIANLANSSINNSEVFTSELFVYYRERDVVPMQSNRKHGVVICLLIIVIDKLAVVSADNYRIDQNIAELSAVPASEGHASLERHNGRLAAFVYD